MLRAFTVKVADFGLSALVRVGEDAGYDALVSKRRKDYTKLHEVTIHAHIRVKLILALQSRGVHLRMKHLKCC
jgi:hypothetical protein